MSSQEKLLLAVLGLGALGVLYDNHSKARAADDYVKQTNARTAATQRMLGWIGAEYASRDMFSSAVKMGTDLTNKRSTAASNVYVDETIEQARSYKDSDLDQ
jgi:hypothetical protein